MKTDLKKFKKEVLDDFNAMIKESTIDEIMEIKNGAYGLIAVEWAKQYAMPIKENEKYKIAYNVFYNYFENLKNKLST